MYAAVFVAHTSLTVVYCRRAFYMYIVSFTALLEMLGYYFRIAAVENYSLSTIILTILFILVPPIFLAIVNYEVVSRLMKASDATVWCLRHNTILRTFLALDILCFLVQCTSAPLMLSNDVAKIKMGSDVILGGLVLQFAVFSLFVGAALKAARHPRLNTPSVPPTVKRALGLCLLTIGLLLLRNGYRVYEYVQQYVHADDRATTVVTNYEWQFYAFEFAPVFLAHVVFAVFNFGWLLPSDKELAAAMQSATSTAAAAVAADCAPAASAVAPAPQGRVSRVQSSDAV